MYVKKQLYYLICYIILEIYLKNKRIIKLFKYINEIKIYHYNFH